MKALIVIGITIIMTTSKLLSQETSDFILTNSGEKIMGKVFQPINMMKEIQLKKTGEADFKAYTAIEIQNYQFKENLYTSCEIKKGEGKIFLLTLVNNGAVKLHSLPVNNAYYIEKEGTFYELNKKDKVVEGKFMEDRRFEGILKVVFDDCKLSDNALQNVKLTAKSLTNMVQQYNICQDPSLIYNKKNKTLNAVKYGVMAGTTFTKGKISNYYSNGLSYNGYSLNYVIGAEILMSLSSLPSLNFRPGIGITRKQAGLINRFSLDETHNSIDYTGLQFPIRLSYFFPSKRISPYVTAGAIFSFPLKHEAINQQIFSSTGNVVAEVREQLDGIYEFGGVGGIGLQYQHSERMHPFLEYQYEKTWLSNSGRWVFTTHNIILGIRF